MELSCRPSVALLPSAAEELVSEPAKGPETKLAEDLRRYSVVKLLSPEEKRLVCSQAAQLVLRPRVIHFPRTEDDISALVSPSLRRTSKKILLGLVLLKLTRGFGGCAAGKPTLDESEDFHQTITFPSREHDKKAKKKSLSEIYSNLSAQRAGKAATAAGSGPPATSGPARSGLAGVDPARSDPARNISTRSTPAPGSSAAPRPPVLRASAAAAAAAAAPPSPSHRTLHRSRKQKVPEPATK